MRLELTTSGFVIKNELLIMFFLYLINILYNNFYLKSIRKKLRGVIIFLYSTPRSLRVAA
nr:MAG TPA: hypothetical protein [Caudoviricetes sp.]